MEHLYMDVLYTIKYKVGADTEQSTHRDLLYVYAQKAFDVTPEQHRRYMAIVHGEKVGCFCALNTIHNCNSLALHRLNSHPLFLLLYIKQINRLLEVFFLLNTILSFNKVKI